MPTKIKSADPETFFNQRYAHPYECLLDGGVWQYEGNGVEFKNVDYFTTEIRKWANTLGKTIKRKVINKGTPQEAVAVCVIEPTDDQKRRTKVLRKFYGLDEDVTVDSDEDRGVTEWADEGQASEDDHVQ